MKRKQRRVHEVQEEEYDYSDDDQDYYAPNVVGTITTVHAVHSKQAVGVKTGLEKIYADVRLNDNTHKTRLKIDTGSDACLLTLADWEKSGLAGKIKLQPSNCILHNYGGGVIKNVGTVKLKVSCKDRSVPAEFRIVDAPGNPSIIGCRKSLELGLLTFNNTHNVAEAKCAKEVEGKKDRHTHKLPVTPAKILTRESVLQDYSDCFDKIGRFPGDKYHIQLVDDAKPVIHAPRTVPVHIMPLYKAELEKMIRDGIITPVTGPTDWVNSIVVNVTETAQARRYGYAWILRT